MSSHKHRKTQKRTEAPHAHTTILTNNEESRKKFEMWERRMMLMDQVTNFRQQNLRDLAEPRQIEICEIDEKLQGKMSSSAGLSWNKLGEIQHEMGKVNEAEKSLKKAVDIRESLGEDFDTSVSRDNLARVYEEQGRMEDARQMRLRGRPAQNISCGNFSCSIQQGLGFDRLKACSQCKVVFYCTPACQKSDWKSRHKKFCKPAVQTANGPN